MFDPEDPKALKRLHGSIDWSVERMRTRREQRMEQLRQYVGAHYGDDGAPDNVPINMIELGVSIFQRAVASHAPEALVSSDYQELLPQAANLGLALNQQIRRMNLKDSFNTTAIEALFCLGVMEVGITAKETPPDGEGYQYDPGQLFADPILLEDLVLDMTAKRWEQQGYVGHDFTVPLEWVLENPLYSKRVREKLTSPDNEVSNDGTRSEEMQTGGSHREEFEDTIRLRQVFLPRQQLVLTFAVGRGKEPLHVVEWTGPEHGPYHPLSYGKVPGNLIPLAPVPLWVDLHHITNTMFNKASRQAERQKGLTLVKPGGTDDAKSIRDARDGDIVSVDDPKNVNEIGYGGQDQQNIAMAQLAKLLLENIAGNWPSIAGLGAQSRTVGQDELMFQNASGKLKDMQQTTLEFQTAVIQDLAYWLWEDPISEYHLIKPIEGTSFSVPTVWSPENRMGKFFDYNFKVNPYSAIPRSPSEQASTFMQFVTQVLIPIMPALQQQGIGIDFEFLFKTFARYQQLPELNRALMYLNGEQMPQRSPVGGHMPANTSRTYERVSRPGATNQGQEKILQNLLSGGNPQESELASVFRTAG